MRTKTAAAIACGLAGVALAGFVLGLVQSRRAARRPPIGRFAGSPGRRIHFVQAGSGPDVVLIHGTAVTLDDMLAGPFGPLADHYRVTAIDRPGHGHSDINPGSATAQAQARVIAEALDELGMERPIIVGHSLGGAVALAYGAARPDRTGGVVAIAPSPIRAGALSTCRPRCTPRRSSARRCRAPCSPSSIRWSRPSRSARPSGPSGRPPASAGPTPPR